MRKLTLSLLTGAILMFAIVAGTARGQSPPPPPPPPGFTPVTISPPCPPTGCPTNTPTITPTPTATPLPTATATPVPVRLRLSMNLAYPAVWPQTKQVVNVSTTRRATVRITVSFPNGDTKKHSAKAGKSGKLSWTFTQPGSRITRKSQTASVTVRAGLSGHHKSATRSYHINFANLDVSVLPRSIPRGSAANVWLHTYNYTRSVWVVMRFPGGARLTIRGHVGKGGWWYTRYVVPRSAHVGRVDVKGWGALRHKAVSGETSYRIR